MPPKPYDFTAYLEKKREQERQAVAAQQLQMRQAKVKADLLMQHEGWDYFLSVLQDRVDQARQQEMEWAVKCAQAILDQDMIFAKQNYNIWKSRAETLDEIMAIPSQMRGQAAQNGPAGNPAHNVEET
jgi:hypothetical protein